MDYNKVYNQLISKAKNRDSLTGYLETHHIIPRSMGGSNSKKNLVNLTGREHFIAHLLLVKIHPTNSGMAIAVLRMRGDKRKISNSRKYEWARRMCSKTMSEHHRKYAKKRWEDLTYRKQISKSISKAHKRTKQSVGENNPMYGRSVKDFMSKDNYENWKHRIAISCGAKPFIAMNNATKLKFISKAECEKVIGVKRAIIRKILKGEQKTTRDGWFFEYTD